MNSNLLSFKTVHQKMQSRTMHLNHDKKARKTVINKFMKDTIHNLGIINK